MKFVDGEAILLTKEELETIKQQEEPYVWVKDWFLIGRNNLQIHRTDQDNQVIGWVDVEEYLEPIKNRCKELSDKAERGYAEREVGKCVLKGCSGVFVIEKEGYLEGSCSNPFCRDYKVTKPLSESYLNYLWKDEKYYYEQIKQIIKEDKSKTLSLQDVVNSFQSAFSVKVNIEDLKKFLEEDK